MKILGEKSASKFDAIIKFLFIDNKDQNSIKSLTTTQCKVYHIDCTYVDNDFYLCDNCWLSSRRINDALSQINQHGKDASPIVIINCIDDDYESVCKYVDKKTKWTSSFKNITIV